MGFAEYVWPMFRTVPPSVNRVYQPNVDPERSVGSEIRSDQQTSSCLHTHAFHVTSLTMICCNFIHKNTMDLTTGSQPIYICLIWWWRPAWNRSLNVATIWATYLCLYLEFLMASRSWNVKLCFECSLFDSPPKGGKLEFGARTPRYGESCGSLLLSACVWEDTSRQSC